MDFLSVHPLSEAKFVPIQSINSLLTAENVQKITIPNAPTPHLTNNQHLPLTPSDNWYYLCYYLSLTIGRTVSFGQRTHKTLHVNFARIYGLFKNFGVHDPIDWPSHKKRWRTGHTTTTKRREKQFKSNISIAIVYKRLVIIIIAAWNRRKII